MKVLIIAPPILKDPNDPSSLLTIPPLGYGGVENVIYALANGLVSLGVEVTLIGVPGSRAINGIEIVREPRTSEQIRKWILENYNKFDVVHDHGCGLVFNKEYTFGCLIPYVSTHHQTGISPYPKNTIYLSFAQRDQAKDENSPIIRIPVIIEDYLLQEDKDDYFLYMGRVSEWKGVLEAASFCNKLKSKLIIAGPSWEPEYLKIIKDNYSDTISYIGNVTGLKRIDLLSKAKAIFVLSRFTKGPWGDMWCEPGSTIVSESSASGTPVISSTNGCLIELVNSNVGFQMTEKEIFDVDLSKFKNKFPAPKDIRKYAEEQWGHILIAKKHLEIYRDINKYF